MNEFNQTSMSKMNPKISNELQGCQWPVKQMPCDVDVCTGQ